jgi:hypothetical protein
VHICNRFFILADALQTPTLSFSLVLMTTRSCRRTRPLSRGRGELVSLLFPVSLASLADLQARFQLLYRPLLLDYSSTSNLHLVTAWQTACNPRAEARLKLEGFGSRKVSTAHSAVTEH